MTQDHFATRPDFTRIFEPLASGPVENLPEILGRVETIIDLDEQRTDVFPYNLASSEAAGALMMAFSIRAAHPDVETTFTSQEIKAMTDLQVKADHKAYPIVKVMTRNNGH